MEKFQSNLTGKGIFNNANYIRMQANQHEMVLRQMGGEVLQLPSSCCYVRFNVGEFRLSYVYNINKSNRYFLERLKPYPLPLKEYENEEDIIESIKIDLEQFQNAANSQNIAAFIKINQELNKTAKAFEDLFLYYNVEKFHTESILNKIQEIEDEIQKTVQESELLYRKSNPNYLAQLFPTKD